MPTASFCPPCSSEHANLPQSIATKVGRCAVSDIGVSMILDAQAGFERLGILMLTTFDLDEYVYDALRAGANGFLLKDVPRAALIGAVRTVSSGDALLSPAVTKKLIERYVSIPLHPEPPQELADLSGREREVLLCIARGRSNAEIAGELHVTEATVKTHVASLLRKLGLRDRVQVVVWAYESGVIRPGV